MQEKWEKCFIKYLIIKVFALCRAWGVSKNKSHNTRQMVLGIVTLLFVICVYSKIITKS